MNDRMTRVRSLRGMPHGKRRLLLTRRLGLWATRVCALAVLAVLFAIRVWDPFPVEALRLQAFDLLQVIEPRAPHADAAVIVDIDERSLREIGQWPWPRDLLADLTLALRRAGAQVIAFDVLFAEPDRMSPASIAERFRELPADAAGLLRRLPSNDRLFADAIRGANVVLGLATTTDAAADGDDDRRKPTPAALIGPDPGRHILGFPGLLRNVPGLEKAAAGLGLFTLGVERDNIVRRVPALYRIGRRIHPSLMVEILRVAAGQTAYAIRTNEAGVESIVVGDRQIPTDNRGRIWVHYATSSRAAYVSATDVLHDRIPAERFAGRIVLVGTSAAGLLDLKATPITGAMPGVEVHAQLLQTVLGGRALTRPSIALGAELVLLLVTGALMIVLVPSLGARWTLALGALIAASLFAGTWYAYTAHGLLLDAAYPAAAGLAIYLLLAAVNYLQGENEKRRIRTAFSRYLSPDLVNRLAEARDELKLGGEQKDMTLLFSDIHGFTGISEHYRAVDLTNLVNAIFNPLTQAIIVGGGTVDKYMGDSIMAFWNAPLDDPDHARHACLAALEMQRCIPRLNADIAQRSRENGFPFKPVKLGIGINTGECCVGNMGSDLRFDYSVLGDTVNIASRLEGQTRLFQVHNVIGETTRDLVPEFAFLELDLVTVFGKTTPVRIFTLLGDERVAATSAFTELKAVHDEMLAAFRGRAWERALDLIGQCRRLAGDFDLSTVYDIYERRIAEFRERTPDPDWTAVFEAKAKA